MHGPEHREDGQHEADGGYPGQRGRSEKASGRPVSARTSSSTPAMSQPINQPIPTPNTTPRMAICTPTSTGPHGYRRRFHPQCHGCADLAPLCLHQARGEVQRRERRTCEEHEREDVVELLVTLRVTRKGSVGGVFLGAHQLQAGIRIARRGLGEKRSLDVLPRDAGFDRQHEVVDQSLSAREFLGGLQRREQHGKVRLSKEGALLHNLEVLGGHGVPPRTGRCRRRLPESLPLQGGRSRRRSCAPAARRAHRAPSPRCPDRPAPRPRSRPGSPSVMSTPRILPVTNSGPSAVATST